MVDLGELVGFTGFGGLENSEEAKGPNTHFVTHLMAVCRKRPVKTSEE